MLSRLPLIAVLTFFLFVSARPVLAEVDTLSPEGCEDLVTEKWLALLDNLKMLELDFFERDHRLLRYWETLYGPLWEARIRKDDIYSINRKAEGEMLYKRYDRAAEDMGALAEESNASMDGRIENMRQALREIPSCCDNAEFRMCMTRKREDISLALDDAVDFLKKRRTDEYEFSSRMRASLDERPSDHDALPHKYSDRLGKASVEGRVIFLQKVRAIREKIELDWPGPVCCSSCSKAGQAVSDDPVLKRVSPDLQGGRGVGGNIVNGSDIRKAFDRYEEENPPLSE